MMLLRIRKLLSILRDPFYLRALLRYRVAAAIEHGPLLRGRSFSFIVDVGANRGQFALVAARLQPQAQIVSFEPLRAPANIYAQIFAEIPRVQLQRCALGSEEGTATVNVSHRDDSSSLLEIGDLQTQLHPGTFLSGTAETQVRRLDDVLGSQMIGLPSLLKIDVQGYELEVLKGAERILDRFSTIYVECSFRELYRGQALAPEVVAYLADRGYVLTATVNMSHDKMRRPIQADFLFERRDVV